jgi:hypothetical protein
MFPWHGCCVFHSVLYIMKAHAKVLRPVEQRWLIHYDTCEGAWLKLVTWNGHKHGRVWCGWLDGWHAPVVVGPLDKEGISKVKVSGHANASARTAPRQRPDMPMQAPGQVPRLRPDMPRLAPRHAKASAQTCKGKRPDMQRPAPGQRPGERPDMPRPAPGHAKASAHAAPRQAPRHAKARAQASAQTC